ncbi:MAG: hypothetical protein ACLRVU_10220 [Beduini sp.]
MESLYLKLFTIIEFFSNTIDALKGKKVIIKNIFESASIDFRIDKNNNFFVFDIAATPYTIKHSSFAFLFNEYELNYENIYKIILDTSLKNTSMLKLT